MNNFSGDSSYSNTLTVKLHGDPLLHVDKSKKVFNTDFSIRQFVETLS